MQQHSWLCMCAEVFLEQMMLSVRHDPSITKDGGYADWTEMLAGTQRRSHGVKQELTMLWSPPESSLQKTRCSSKMYRAYLALMSCEHIRLVVPKNFLSKLLFCWTLYRPVHI